MLFFYSIFIEHLICTRHYYRYESESENRLVVSDSCNPWTVVHGILQARILEWEAFPLSRGSSQSRDQTQVSRIAG